MRGARGQSWKNPAPQQGAPARDPCTGCAETPGSPAVHCAAHPSPPPCPIMVPLSQKLSFSYSPTSLILPPTPTLHLQSWSFTLIPWCHASAVPPAWLPLPQQGHRGGRGRFSRWMWGLTRELLLSAELRGRGYPGFGDPDPRKGLSSPFLQTLAWPPAECHPTRTLWLLGLRTELHGLTGRTSLEPHPGSQV